MTQHQVLSLNFVQSPAEYRSEEIHRRRTVVQLCAGARTDETFTEARFFSMSAGILARHKYDSAKITEALRLKLAMKRTVGVHAARLVEQVSLRSRQIGAASG